MKIAWDNKSDLAEVATTSQNLEFPATNVQGKRLSVPWKTAADFISPMIMFGFGNAYQPEVLVIAGHDLGASPAATSLKLLAGDTMDALNTTFTIPIIDGVIYFDIAEATPDAGTYAAYRIWALEFTKNSISDIKKIGRIFLGPILDTGELGDPDYDGLTETTRDRSEFEESINGEEYLEKKSQVRTWNLDMSLVPEDSLGPIRTAYASIGKATPFFIKISEVSPLDEILYVRLTNDLGRKVGAFDSEFHWNTALGLKEFI